MVGQQQHGHRKISLGSVSRRGYVVYLVESGDFDEGRALEELFSSSGLPFYFERPLTRDDFLRCLSKNLKAAQTRLTEEGRLAGDEVPILHLSSHGWVSPRNGRPSPSSSWIVLADDEGIRWPEIREAISDLNDAFDGKLILCVSTCHGIQADQIAMRTDRPDPPFHAMVANSTSVDVGDCERAFLAFYKSVLAGASLEEAVHEMRFASGNNNFVVHNGRETTEPFNRLMASIRDGELVELRELYRQSWRQLKTAR